MSSVMALNGTDKPAGGSRLSRSMAAIGVPINDVEVDEPLPLTKATRIAPPNSPKLILSLKGWGQGFQNEEGAIPMDHSTDTQSRVSKIGVKARGHKLVHTFVKQDLLHLIELAFIAQLSFAQKLGCE